MKAIVVAYDKNRGIGAKNDLPWGRSLPGDLKRFKSLTFGKTIIMGLRTFESIGRALPGRENIVLTSQDVELPTSVRVARSLDEAYDMATHDSYIIGGGMVYEQTVDDVDVIYATEVHATFDDVDVFFPALDDSWCETSRIACDADDQDSYAYDFVTYKRN